MDLRSLRYFVAAVEHCSITSAAEHCHVAQPSISLAINKLEEELDTRLLERSKKGVKPTPAGSELFFKAQRLLAESEGIVKYFTQRQPLRTLTLQMEITLSLDRMRYLLGQFQSFRHSYQLEITKSQPEADIRLSRLDDLPENYRFCPLWEDEYCLLLPLDHPLASKVAIEVSDIHNLPIVERTFCERSELWADFTSRYQLSPRVVAQTDSEEWALALVESGIGACIAPAPDALKHHRIRVYPLSSIPGLPRILRTVGLAWSPLTPKPVGDFLAEWSDTGRPSPTLRAFDNEPTMEN